MCGIAGILRDDDQSQAEAEVLDRMLVSIAHRGPDDTGTLIDRELALGMRRLSIIDLAGGQQPIFDESRRYGVVCNGEIYNYRELRSELSGRGHQFATHSDTEVIVHLYEESAESCLDRLRGMYACAVWDRQQRRLFIARDRLGIKPLYYIQVNGQFLFASEIKALLQHPDVHAQLDLTALSHYLSLKYVPAPRTMFQGIHALPPGHYLTVQRGQIEIQRYWDLSFPHDVPSRSEDECAEQLAALLRESIGLHLRSDVSFGAFLSGGLDSSLIVALMSEQLTTPVKTFSVGFEGGDESDELPYARQVARRFHCDHYEVVVTATDFLEHAESVLWHLDQPIADQATMATQVVARLASQHVKMVLTGEGGDELFAGYARYVGEQYSPWFQYLPRAAGAGLRRALPLLPGLRRPKIALHALSLRDEAARFANWFPLFNDDAKAELLTSEVKRWERDHANVSPFIEQLHRCDATSPLHRMLYVDTKLWLPDYLLLRGDKLTMANSLEGRVPLLDHKLVEFAAGLPESMKLHGGVRKYLLKRVARDLLPPEIIHRKKQGFPIPIAAWLRGAARDLMHDLLAPEIIQRRGLFAPQVVERLVRQHVQGTRDHADLLWGLMSVELWQRRFIDSDVMLRDVTSPRPLPA